MLKFLNRCKGDVKKSTFATFVGEVGQRCIKKKLLLLYQKQVDFQVLTKEQKLRFLKHYKKFVGQVNFD